MNTTLRHLAARSDGTPVLPADWVAVPCAQVRAGDVLLAASAWIAGTVTEFEVRTVTDVSLSAYYSYDVSHDGYRGRYANWRNPVDEVGSTALASISDGPPPISRFYRRPR